MNMYNERPAFGERLEDLVELGAIEFQYITKPVS
jgi:hypothetical protein